MSVRGNVIPAVALCIAFAVGCGDDDDDGGTDALTKTEFVERANQICADGNAEIEAAFEEAGGPPSRAEAEAVIADTVVPSIQRQVDEIRSLTPPEGDEGTVTAFLDEAEAILDDVGDDPALLYESEQRDEDPFAPVNEDLAAYGLTACAGDDEGGQAG